MARPPLDLVRRRVIGVAVIAGLPLLLLSVVEGRAFGGVELPFIRDIEAHVRYLVSLPLLILAELIVHLRMRPLLAPFVERGLVVGETRALRRDRGLGDAPAQLGRHRGDLPGLGLHRRAFLLESPAYGGAGDLARIAHDRRIRADLGRILGGLGQHAAVPVPPAPLVLPDVPVVASPQADLAAPAAPVPHASRPGRRAGLPGGEPDRLRPAAAGPVRPALGSHRRTDPLPRRVAGRLQASDRRRRGDPAAPSCSSRSSSSQTS